MNWTASLPLGCWHAGHCPVRRRKCRLHGRSLGSSLYELLEKVSNRVSSEVSGVCNLQREQQAAGDD